MTDGDSVVTDFVMPALGADMEHGTLLEWRVREGDEVLRGEVIALVETDKAAIEVEVFHSGTVEALLVAPGARVPVGTPLARIRGAASAARPVVPVRSAAAEPGGSSEASAPAVAPITATSTASWTAGASQRRRVSPLARNAALRLGVELESVRGTGPGGAVTQADVERAAAGAATRVAEPPTRATSAARDRTTSMRRAIAAAVSRSNREIPHYYLEETVDCSEAVRWLRERNGGRRARERIVPGALFVRAVALACRAVPQLNGRWVDDALHVADGVHVGMAISLRDGGLLAPAILDADRKRVPQVMSELVEMTRSARHGVLRGAQLTSSTITVTSLGERGAERVFGVIYPPQVALVGFGRISERPSVANGRLEVRPQVAVTLAADHRATDGYTGGQFLAAIARGLQQPEVL